MERTGVNAALASALALSLLAGVSAQSSPAPIDCSSLGAALRSFSEVSAASDIGRSVTTTAALMADMGFTDELIASLNKPVLLAPTDKAWVDFVRKHAGPDPDPVAFIKGNPNAIKQILLYHFVDKVEEENEGVTATGLSSLKDLTDFIDVDLICGRADSEYVKVQYTPSNEDTEIYFQEPVSGHFRAASEEDMCGDGVTLITIDTVMTPCPTEHMFSGSYGCMTVAAAASQIPDHLFGTAPYDAPDDSILGVLKHPNALTGSADGYSVFLPTKQALEDAGVMAADFRANTAAVEDIVRGHIVPQEVCTSSEAPAEPLKTMAENGACEVPKLKIAASAEGLTVSAGDVTAKTTPQVDNAVCGGILHVVDSTLLPCTIAQYSNAGTPVVQERSADPAAGSITATTTAQADGVISLAGALSGLVAAVVALLA